MRLIIINFVAGENAFSKFTQLKYAETSKSASNAFATLFYKLFFAIRARRGIRVGRL